MTFTGANQDTVAQARISWTSSFTLNNDETIVLSLTSAPSASAVLQIGTAASAGTAMAAFETVGDTATDSSIISASLTTAAGEALDPDIASGTSGSVSLQVNTAGTYTGSLAVWNAGASAADTVSFTFTQYA